MDSLTELVDPQIVLVVGAIAVSLLLVRLLFQVFQASFGSMVAILALVLILYYVFGISPKQLWFEISHLPQDLAKWARSFT
jgi:hypothetical protein